MTGGRGQARAHAAEDGRTRRWTFLLGEVTMYSFIGVIVQFPGMEFISRSRIIHVLLIPRAGHRPADRPRLTGRPRRRRDWHGPECRHPARWF